MDKLLCEMKNCDGVDHVMINSTMGRYCTINSETLHCDTQMPIEASDGKALIICNTGDRKHWKKEYEYAKGIFERQMGLEVKQLFCF